MRQIRFEHGEPVIFKNKKYIIKQELTTSSILAEEAESGRSFELPIKDLEPFSIVSSHNERDIETYTEKELEKAQWRYRIIKPVLENPGNLEIVKQQAAEAKVHFASIYRWVNTYESTGLVSSLTGLKKNGGKDKGRLESGVEEIITASIQEVLMNKKRLPVNSVIYAVKKACVEKQLKPPHDNTIRKRIQNISEEDRMRARLGSKKADERYKPSGGKFPGADFPLSVVQIDHTLLDVILVDEVYRNAVGRPWLTVAIDVYSRMIVGFYLAFERPGALATGLCLAHSILPKEMWLGSLDISGEWPCWGVPKKIHMDNAREFRGYTLTKACLKYGIDIEYRPVKTPNYGGHIERFCGTLSKEIHTLPGTTFSNIKQRDGFPSEKTSVMTLAELEKWLSTYLVEVYHNKLHNGILSSPLEKFKEGLLGSSTQSGVGFAPRIFDERRLKLDFMPYEERTIQDYGVAIDHIHYYHDVLRNHVNRIDLSSGKARLKKKYIFRRDPRDISVIYFYDQDLNEYFPIPYRDTSKPRMSMWEHKEILRQLTVEGKKNIDENAIFEGYEKLREQVETATAKSKSMRKNARNIILPKPEIHQTFLKSEPAPPIQEIAAVSIKRNIKPFDETEEYGAFK